MTTATTTTADRATMIRPGLMVLVRTSVHGGVSYQRVDLDAADGTILDEEYSAGVPGKACTACNSAWPANEPEAHSSDCAVAARRVTRWETTKVVDDPAEFAAASKVRNQARSLIRKACASTSFGLLCPEAREAELDECIRAARALVSAHNATARSSHVAVYAIKGRVASDDREAVAAIASEVRDLVADMNAGILACDPKAIRDAADKARDVSAMLAPQQAEVVADAVKQARAAARVIVSRVQTNGEEASVVLLDVQRGAIEKARIAFLDLDDGPGIASAGPAMPAVNVQRFQDLDTSEGVA